MTDDEKEVAYDADVAPLLFKAPERATELGMPMICNVEYNASKLGTTRSGFKIDDASLKFAMILIASRANCNLDALVIDILRLCDKRGIDVGASIVARMLRTTIAPHLT